MASSAQAERVERAARAISLDDVRARFPGLGVAIYAYDPLGLVTLEIHEGGRVYPFVGATEREAILAAFPELEVVEDELLTAPDEPAPLPALFD